jgi:hypothetical protein
MGFDKAYATQPNAAKADIQAIQVYWNTACIQSELLRINPFPLRVWVVRQS